VVDGSIEQDLMAMACNAPKQTRQKGAMRARFRADDARPSRSCFDLLNPGRDSFYFPKFASRPRGSRRIRDLAWDFDLARSQLAHDLVFFARLH